MVDFRPTYPGSAPRHELVIPCTVKPLYCDINEGKKLVQVNAKRASFSKKLPNHSLNVENKAPYEVLRAGRIVQITRPSRRLVSTNLAAPTGRTKYSSTPIPQFKLLRAAFPLGTPDYIVEQARRSFASSVSSTSQASYTSAYNHLVKAEALLGRSFSSPPTES